MELKYTWSLLFAAMFLLSSAALAVAITNEAMPTSLRTPQTAVSTLNSPPDPELSPKEPLQIRESARSAAAQPMAECGSVPTNGCTISVSTNFTPGAYALTDGIMITANNVVLDCKGASIYGTKPEFTIATGIGVYEHSNVTIKNCNIAKYYMGISLGSGTNITLIGNQIVDNINIGVAAYSVNNFVMDSNRIDLTSYSDKIQTHSGVTYQYGRNALFKNNNLSDNNVSESALHFFGACNVTIAGNKLIRNSIGLTYNNYFDDPTVNSSSCSYGFLIENNTFSENVRGLMSWATLNGWSVFPTTIKRNTFSNHTRGALYFVSGRSQTLVTNNVFRNSDWYDIGLYGYTNNMEISYNNGSARSWFSSEGVNNYGIYLKMGFQGPSTNVSIHDNLFTNYRSGIGIWYNNGTGISLPYYSPKVTIYKNKISNGYIGINVYYSDNTTIKENNITNNYAGLQLQGSTNTTFVYLNNIYANSFVNVESYEAAELSYSKFGNYWGHASPPCFIVGVDALQTFVNDSYAVCKPIINKSSIAIPLNKAGWFFFSFPQQPDSSAPVNMFAPIAGKFEVVQANMNGVQQKYIPGGFNTLTKMDPWRSYWIKIISGSSQDLVIVGNKTTQCYPLALAGGGTKHWTGYWLDYTKPVSQALSSLTGNYEYIRVYDNGVWKTYMPAQPQFSDLTSLEPGRGYMVKMTNADTLDYICG